MHLNHEMSSVVISYYVYVMISSTLLIHLVWWIWEGYLCIDILKPLRAAVDDVGLGMVVYDPGPSLQRLDKDRVLYYDLSQS